ncbi:metalloregulator ArsR/SmtB family transcription factor [Clostridium sediminicola]|uniref:ArsR/SmtB family transcription factor n=1 Tax=Clostridium sediminicola TaxID=3114879 RepID=UPI0031F1EA7D
MDELTNLFKVLSDETRLRILIIMYHRELCVCQMQGILEESQPKISKHLAKLRDMGFVKDQREEQYINYYLSDNKMLRDILEGIIEQSGDNEKITKDLERLKEADIFKEIKIRGRKK